MVEKEYKEHYDTTTHHSAADHYDLGLRRQLLLASNRCLYPPAVSECRMYNLSSASLCHKLGEKRPSHRLISCSIQEKTHFCDHTSVEILTLRCMSTSSLSSASNPVILSTRGRLSIVVVEVRLFLLPRIAPLPLEPLPRAPAAMKAWPPLEE